MIKPRRYMIVGDYVTCGGPKNYSRDTIYLKDSSLSDAISFARKLGLVEEVNMDTILSTPEDTMGSYRRIEIIIDSTIDTLFSNMSHCEKQELINYTNSWMLNEMAIVPDLADKIKGYDNELKKGAISE